MQLNVIHLGEPNYSACHIVAVFIFCSGYYSTSTGLLFVLVRILCKANTKTWLNSSPVVNLRLDSCRAVPHSLNWLWRTFLSVFYSSTRRCQGLITPPHVSNGDLNHGCRRPGEQDVCSWKHALFYSRSQRAQRLIRERHEYTEFQVCNITPSPVMNE